MFSHFRGFASDDPSLRPRLRAVLDELVREAVRIRLLVLLLMVVAIPGVYTLYHDDV